MVEKYEVIGEEVPLSKKGEKRSLQPIICAFLASSLVVMDSVSIASQAWIQSDSVNAGIWYICYSGSCHNYTKVQEYVKIVRGFQISALVFSVLVSTLSFLGICMEKLHTKKIGKFLATLLVFACVCNIVAASVFTAWYPMTSGQFFGYSYVLAWVAGVISLLTAIWSTLTSY